MSPEAVALQAARTLHIADAPSSISDVPVLRRSLDLCHCIFYEDILGPYLDKVFDISWHGDYPAFFRLVHLSLKAGVNVRDILPELREGNLGRFQVVAVRL